GSCRLSTAMTPSEACFRHPGSPVRGRCGDCGRGMCGVCFDEAAWPWKVCADCQPKREAAQAAPPPVAPPPAATAPVGSTAPAAGSAALECLAYNLAGFVIAATPTAVVVGPILVVAIAVASWVAGRSRLLLLLLFVPGAYLTLIALTLLVALQGALVLAVLFAVSF